MNEKESISPEEAARMENVADEMMSARERRESEKRNEIISDYLETCGVDIKDVNDDPDLTPLYEKALLFQEIKQSLARSTGGSVLSRGKKVEIWPVDIDQIAQRDVENRERTQKVYKDRMRRPGLADEEKKDLESAIQANDRRIAATQNKDYRFLVQSLKWQLKDQISATFHYDPQYAHLMNWRKDSINMDELEKAKKSSFIMAVNTLNDIRTIEGHS